MYRYVYILCSLYDTVFRSSKPFAQGIGVVAVQSSNCHLDFTNGWNGGLLTSVNHIWKMSIVTGRTSNLQHFGNRAYWCILEFLPAHAHSSLESQDNIEVWCFSFKVKVCKSPRCFPAPPFSCGIFQSSLHRTPGGPNLRRLNRSGLESFLGERTRSLSPIWAVVPNSILCHRP